MKREKKLIMLILLIIGIMVIGTNNVQALEHQNIDPSSYAIPSEYAFTPNFIKNKTEVATNYGALKTYEDTKYYLITGVTDFSDIYALYKNVGTYQGKTVDLKIQLDSYTVTTTCTEQQVYFAFGTSYIGLLSGRNCGDVRVSFTIYYFEHDTNKILNIKNNITFSDIDAAEKIWINNSLTDYSFAKKMPNQHIDVVASSSITTYEGNLYHTCTEPEEDYTGQTGECLKNGATNCLNGTCEDCVTAGKLTVLNNSGKYNISWQGAGIGITSAGFLKINDMAPLKTADQKEIEIGKELTYDIEQYVPNQSSNFYYTKWQIEDKISDEFEVEKDDIKIINDADKDVTKLFDIEVEKNIVTITAKDETIASADFYNATYNISIKVTVKKDIDMKDKESIDVTNKASLITNFDTKSSNEVTVKIIPVTVAVPDTGLFVNIGVMILGIAMIVGGYFLLIKPKKQTVEE